MPTIAAARKSQAPAGREAGNRRRVLFASLIGTTIEFFDFYIYATAAVLVFPHLFFPPGDPGTATKIALRSLARRHRALSVEIADLDELLGPLVAQINPGLLALKGIGPDVAGQMLVTAGENADRLTNEAAFAMLCGVAPLPASSGRTTRHRLNRGGDRAANSALWRIVITRMGTDDRTKNYIARRTAQGLTKPEIIRCLKRYVAREVFLALTSASAEKRPAKAA